MADRRGRPITLPEPWRTLAERAGGVGNLAEKFRVLPREVRRWARGDSGMTGPAKVLFEIMMEEAGIRVKGNR